MKTRRTGGTAPVAATPPPSTGAHRLVWVKRGAVVARDAGTIYLVPQGHGLWAPAGSTISTHVAPGSDVGSTSLHTALLPMRFATVAGFEIAAPARRESWPGTADGRERDTWHAVSDVLTPAHPAMTLVLPSDPTLREIAEKILGAPSGSHVTERYAAATGMQAATLSSRFRRQTGLSLSQWHSRVRLYAAVFLLGQGISAGEVAHSIGYAGPSGLSAAHKRLFGVTPMAFKRRGRRSSLDGAVGFEVDLPCPIADTPEPRPPEPR